MRKGPLVISKSFSSKETRRISEGRWRCWEWGGGHVPFLHKRAGLLSAPEAAFLAVRKEDRSVENHFLWKGNKYLRLHVKEWTDRWTKGRALAEGPCQAQVLPCPKDGQVRKGPASLQVQDSPTLALLSPHRLLGPR